MERDALRYQRLRDYLLVHGMPGLFPFQARKVSLSCLGNNFYGPSFGEAVDHVVVEIDQHVHVYTCRQNM